jgi:hypothetical protein
MKGDNLFIQLMEIGPIGLHQLTLVSQSIIATYGEHLRAATAVIRLLDMEEKSATQALDSQKIPMTSVQQAR